MKEIAKTKILALTTDPYENIYGYSIVFLKLMGYMKKHNKNIEITIFSNDGISSKNIDSIKINLNKADNIISKTVKLAYLFYRKVDHYPSDTVILVNCEIPELIAGVFLSKKFKKVFCVIQDTRIRDRQLKTILICSFREFLVRMIKNVIFTNKYTMNTFTGNINKYYIGNPIFN